MGMLGMRATFYQRSQEGALEGGAVLPHVLANVATLASSQLLLQRSAG